MTDLERMELDGALHRQIVALSEKADALAYGQDYYQALVLYNKALGLVPEPRTSWGASLWLLGSIGDAAFQGGYFETARDALGDAMLCPGAVGNPFLHLRLGEAHFELGDQGAALEELTRAYMGAGEDIFESEDPKFLTLLRDNGILAS